MKTKIKKPKNQTMKKLFVIFLFVAFSSCSKKEGEKFCWSCVTTAKQTVTGQTPTTGTSSSTICDQTEEGIRKIEQSAQTTTTSTSMGISVTIVSSMKCTKK